MLSCSLRILLVFSWCSLRILPARPFRVQPKDLVAVRRLPKHPWAMKRMLCSAALLLPASILAGAVPGLASDGDSASQNDQRLADYFRAQTAEISAHCLADVRALEDWQARRGEYRRQLEEMLGLWPMPERADLKPVITGTLEHPEFTVERLHFQALPRLYVTANLYLP